MTSIVSIMVEMQCAECGRTFKVKPYLVRQGFGKFCSAACYGKWQSKNRKGVNNFNYVEKITVRCDYCNVEKDIIPWEYKNRKYHFCSQDCFHRWEKESGFMSGEQNPHWLGGHSDYRGSNWEEQKEKALKRDNYTCQKCPSKENIGVHHKIPYHLFDSFKSANVLSNLITLCKKCHRIEELEFNKNNKDLIGNRRIPHHPPESKICEKCNEPFIPNSPNAKWCIKCRTSICIQCGKELENKKHRDVKFCSKECRNRHVDTHAKWSRKCARCNTKIKAGRIFCKKCFLSHIKPSSKSFSMTKRLSLSDKSLLNVT